MKNPLDLIASIIEKRCKIIGCGAKAYEQNGKLHVSLFNERYRPDFENAVLDRLGIAENKLNEMLYPCAHIKSVFSHIEEHAPDSRYHAVMKTARLYYILVFND